MSIGRVSFWTPGEVGVFSGGQGVRTQGESGGLLFGQVGDVPGDIAVHLDDVVRRVEIGPGAARHQNGGQAPAVIQLPHPVQEGGDRLHVPADDPLHQLVPDHKVGGAGVLVHKQHPGPGLQSLHHVGRLRGAAAGVLGGESGGVLAVGQAPDEHRDVGVHDAPPVLRPDLHGRGIGDDILPAIPGDVVIHPQLQGFQQGGLAVIAPAHDEGHPPGDAHAGEFAPVGQVQGDG